ncbi:hypothetical protein [Aquiflexum lacus]|uniref:hypothetical protein n=1 Tax=Aquiflexum lacus TaxID=2483805 RepID=UPI001893341D|nr:hypothetical protein [Aquiflexum lacus]
MQRIVLALIILFLISIGLVFPQDIQFELTKVEGQILENSGFDLVEVLDVQNNSTSIGSIYSVNNQIYNVKIKNSISQGIKNFYTKSLQQTETERAIQIRVVDFKISEKQQSSKVAAGELKIKFSYYLKGSFEPVHLVDYEAGITYQRSIHRTDLVNQILNKGVSNSLIFFNDWIKDHATYNRKLAKSVKLQIFEKSRKSDQDTVFYDFNRPLNWNDFLERPSRTNRNNAMIFTSLAMEGNPFMEDGELLLPLEIKVYMLPGSSWVRADGRNDYSLNHEQRHFDVSRIVGNRLINKLKTLDLNPENYEAEVNDAFFDSFREMNKLQEIYDARTRHGLDRNAQYRWDNILDQALKGNMEEIEKELIKGK